MKYAEPIMRKKFSAESFDEARKEAVKWFNKYVACKDELKDVVCSINKDEKASKGQYPTVALTLFTFIDVEDIKKRHCEICRQFHKSFFINENCNCFECKAMALNERLSETIKTKKGFYKEMLKKLLSIESE